jgi:SAM-dependent methyltransferase
MDGHYREINRKGWGYLARNGCDASLPYGPEHFARAREWLDAQAWIPWGKVGSVLCLGAGGGQQAPLFSSLNCQVTVVDLSPDQLQQDQKVAERYGFDIECIEADMLDLSLMHGREFDLVYQAISACYVPDVHRLYKEVFRVLKPGGYYRVEHWNPVHVQLSEIELWNGQGYCIVHPQTPGEPVPWTAWNEKGPEPSPMCWHYIHPLGHLIGGLCEAGFVILRFEETCQGDLSAEPGTHLHLAAYLPPFFTLFAQSMHEGLKLKSLTLAE